MSLFDLVIPVTLFSAASLSSPGPNNVMVAASGVNFGFRRTIPHMLGIAIGFAVMNLAVGLGLGRVFETYPQIHVVLKYLSISYLVFLAWKIANSGPVKEGGRRAEPFTFLQAAAFQWVNPKAWAVAVGAVATFTTVGGNLLAEVVVMSLIFLLWTIPSASIWIFFGTVIGRFLHTPRRLKAFNWFMAGLLLLSLVPAIV